VESTAIELPIVEVTHAEAMDKFVMAYLADGLGVNNPKDSRWFMSEVACGCLVKASKSVARIKGTITLKEWRNLGYGEAILERLIEEAQKAGFTKIEVFSKYPTWFANNGFTRRRVTSWGVAVMEKDLNGN
jgi:GNAT superfamily N-acetyltransferase